MRYQLLNSYEVLHEVDMLMKHVPSWKPYPDWNPRKKSIFATQGFTDKFAQKHRNSRIKK